MNRINSTRTALADAMVLRNHFIERFERADAERRSRRSSPATPPRCSAAGAAPACDPLPAHGLLHLAAQTWR
jgi:hypothetical protein